MDARTLKMLHLIDALEEQFPSAPHVPEECVWWWTEDDARAWYASGGKEKPEARDDAATLKKWFPGLERSGTQRDKPRMRVLCFPNAGNTEDMFTHEGTGERRAKSPLLEWAKTNDAEILAVQYAGRANRKDESFAFDIYEITEPLLPIVARKLNEIQYVVIGHSVGAWIGFEFLHLLRSRGCRMPEHVFFSSFPFPDIQHVDRPWRINVHLDEEAFKNEIRKWDVNELIFGGLWSVYHDLMRADFHLFDKYDYAHAGKENFSWPLTVFHGENDRMITYDMVACWETHTSGPFEGPIIIPGHHLFPLQKEQKSLWLTMIVERLEKVEID